jgi:hypothetical protein
VISAAEWPAASGRDITVNVIAGGRKPAKMRQAPGRGNGGLRAPAKQCGRPGVRR